MSSARLARLVFLSLLLAGTPVAVAETAVRLSDIRPGVGSGLSNLDAAVLGDKLYFNATANGTIRDLWVYDGIAAPAMVAGGAGLKPQFLTVWQGALYFLGGPNDDRELWRYDGVNPPVEALDLFAAGSGLPQFLTAFGPELCFEALTSTAVGEELVCWDGATPPDVYDLRPGSNASAPDNLEVAGSRLYFEAFDDSVGDEPRVYQNFSPPTLLADVRPGLASSLPYSFEALGATLYFAAADSGGADRVWSWDGVVPPAVVSSDLTLQGGIGVFGGRLLGDGFIGGGDNQMHVLRAGGFAPAPWEFGSIFAAERFFEHRNALYFFSSPSLTAGDLFRYCGGGSVERVTEQFAGNSYISPGFVVFQGRIYFAAADSTNGGELWAIDPFAALFCDGFEEGDDTAWSASLP